MTTSIRLREPAAGLSHLAGALLGGAGLVFLLNTALAMGSPRHVVGFARFGGTMVITYLTSALYHLLDLTPAGTRRLRRCDHAAIYLFIAGSYTPVFLLALEGPLGTAALVGIWTLALAGVAMKLLWLEAPRWAVVGPYLLMGWFAVLCIVPLWRALPAAGLGWILAEGAFYSLGAVIYAMKRPDPLPGVFGFHEIWHLFVIAGSLCHFVAVAGYLI
ncbi:MAG: hemolysin III family protein [Pseudomonadota bacterium]